MKTASLQSGVAGAALQDLRDGQTVRVLLAPAQHQVTEVLILQ